MDQILFDTSTKHSRKGYLKSAAKNPEALFGSAEESLFVPKKKSYKNTKKSTEKTETQIDLLATGPRIQKEKVIPPKLNPLAEFIKENPELQPFYTLTPITELNLTLEQKKYKVRNSCNVCFQHIRECCLKFPQIEEKLQSEKEVAESKAEKIIPKKYNSRHRTQLIALYHTLILDEVLTKIDSVSKVHEIVSELLKLIQIFNDNETENELLVSEQALDDFITNSPNIYADKHIHEIKNRVKERLQTIDILPDLNQIFNTCRPIFKPSQQYFPDEGSSENLFQRLLYSKKDPMFEKGLARLIDHPDLSGKILVKLCEAFSKDEEQITLLYLLMARWAFGILYRNQFQPIISDFLLDKSSMWKISEFRSRVKALRTVSPVGFNIMNGTIPERFATIPLDTFPKTNEMPYTESIKALESIRFNYCPIDFCYSIHQALRLIQARASEESYSYKFKVTHRIGAKSDHLLALDDLFDITLMVFLLSDIDEVPGMVEAFKPYIAGLEMVSELEFAFTNIDAIISHIMNMDLNKFMNEAKERMHELLDIDPLHILG